MSLKLYIEEKNRFARFFKDSEYPTNPSLLTPEQKTALAERLASDLSPEVLHMDGERRGVALQKQIKYLAAVRKDLEALGVEIPAY